MDHSSLINSLSADLAPIRRGSADRDLAFAGLAGGSVSLAAIVSIMGIQPGLATVAGAMPFFLKVAYAGSLAAVALVAVVNLARPGSARLPYRNSAMGVIVALSIMAAFQLAQAPAGHAGRLLLGASWEACSLRIAALSLPILGAIMLAVRRQAPVRLREAGAVAGLASGGAAAALYALACTESAAPFVLAWYSLGIAVSTMLGGWLGPRILRW